jgi:hypothetical protein
MKHYETLPKFRKSIKQKHPALARGVIYSLFRLRRSARLGPCRLSD